MGIKRQELCKVCGNPNPVGQQVLCGSEECRTAAHKEHVVRYHSSPRGLSTLSAAREKSRLLYASDPEYKAKMLGIRRKSWAKKKLARVAKVLDPKPCAVCGNPFVPPEAHSKICSAECKKAKHRVQARDSLRAKVLREREAKGLPPTRLGRAGVHPETCQHPGCAKRFYCRDLCQSHYMKARRVGAIPVKHRKPSVNTLTPSVHEGGGA